MTDRRDAQALVAHTSGLWDAARLALARAQAENRAAMDAFVAAREALARTVECPDCRAPVGAPCRDWGEEVAHLARHSAAREVAA